MSRYNRRDNEFEEKVIRVSRVSKKTKGGDNFGFSVLMVVGDKKGKVGVGLGKAKDVVSAIRKGVRRAKKQMIDVPLDGTTIPFPVRVKKGAGEVLLKPAPEGTGVIAGGPVRAVVEAAGISDISAKILGSENQASSVYATMEALKRIKRIVKVRGIKLYTKKEDQPEEETSKKQVKSGKSETKKDEKKTAKGSKSGSKEKKAEPKEEKKAAKKTKAQEKSVKKESKKVEAKEEKKETKKKSKKEEVKKSEKKAEPKEEAKKPEKKEVKKEEKKPAKKTEKKAEPKKEAKKTEKKAEDKKDKKEAKKKEK